MPAGSPCPVCASPFAPGDALAAHFVELAGQSDARHIMWMNRHVTKLKMRTEDLRPLLEAALSGEAPEGVRVRR